MLSYLYSWFYPEKDQESKEIKYPEITSHRISLISETDLLKVNLKSINVIPSPARNMPNMDKFTLQVLSKAQLDDILAVKLKKAEINPVKTHYEPRHPVLQELLKKHFKC